MKTISPYTTKYTNGQVRTGNRVIKPNILKPIVGHQIVTHVNSKDYINLNSDYKFKLDVYGNWYFDLDYQNNISITNDSINKNSSPQFQYLDNPIINTPTKYGIVFYTTYLNDQIINNCSGIRIKCMNSIRDIKDYENIYITDESYMKIECYVYKQYLYDNFDSCLNDFNNLLTLNNYICVSEYNYCYSSEVEHVFDNSLKDIYNILYENINFLPGDNYQWIKHDNCYELIFDTKTVDAVTDVEIRINGNMIHNQFSINKAILKIIFPVNTISAVDNISLLVKFTKKVG